MGVNQSLLMIVEKMHYQNLLPFMIKLYTSLLSLFAQISKYIFPYLNTRRCTDILCIRLMMVEGKVAVLIFFINFCGVLSGKQDTLRCIKDLSQLTTGLKNKEIWAVKSKYET